MMIYFLDALFIVKVDSVTTALFAVQQQIASIAYCRVYP